MFSCLVTYNTFISCSSVVVACRAHVHFRPNPTRHHHRGYVQKMFSKLLFLVRLFRSIISFYHLTLHLTFSFDTFISSLSAILPACLPLKVSDRYPQGMGTFVPPGSQHQHKSTRSSSTASMDDSVHSASSASAVTSPTSGGAKVFDAGPSGSGAASHLLDNVAESLMFWNAKIRYELSIIYVILSQLFLYQFSASTITCKFLPFFPAILSAPQTKGRL